ncbi:MAG: hypothetical protein IT309_12315, partial [Anaerolineales bacterium]|nr:hypothetical protein [Anaerolineales bacterium]
PMDVAPLKNHLIQNGVYVFHFKNILIAAPPLIITREQLDDGLQILDEGITAVMDKQAAR